MSLFKKALYNGIYLKKDVEEMEKVIKDEYKANAFLGKINPSFYLAIFEELIERGHESKVRQIKAFKKNEKVYEYYFLEDEMKLMAKNIDNKKRLKELFYYVPEKFVRDVYLYLLDELPKEKAKEIAPYGDYIAMKKDLEILLNEPISKELVEKNKEIQSLKEEIKTLKSMETLVSIEKEEEKEETDVSSVKEKTDKFGKELFS